MSEPLRCRDRRRPDAHFRKAETVFGADELPPTLNTLWEQAVERRCSSLLRDSTVSSPDLHISSQTEQEDRLTTSPRSLPSCLVKTVKASRSSNAVNFNFPS